MDSYANGKIVQILMVEDSPGDVRLAQEALRGDTLCNDLHVVGDGEEALAFLRNQGEYGKKPRPDLILLDLNLPRKNGLETLAEIKSDPQLKSIPVVILTVSKAADDILKGYHLHANCYISKPVELDKFFKVVQKVNDFWFNIVKLPPAD